MCSEDATIRHATIAGCRTQRARDARHPIPTGCALSSRPPAPRTAARAARRPWSPGNGSSPRPASSPASGRWPISQVTMPPTVSNSSSLNSLPKRSLKSAIGVSALTRKRPSGCGWISFGAPRRSSCSSSMSPTICSSTSSIVTRPATPPYSSTTIAMWLRDRRNSLSRMLRRFDSGIIATGRSSARMSHGAPRRRGSAADLWPAGCRGSRPCRRRAPGSANGPTR